jgi:hypothetical protein
MLHVTRLVVSAAIIALMAYAAPCHSAAKTLDALASDRELPRCGAGPNDNVAAHGSREAFNAGNRR